MPLEFHKGLVFWYIHSFICCSRNNLKTTGSGYWDGVFRRAGLVFFCIRPIQNYGPSSKPWVHICGHRHCQLVHSSIIARLFIAIEILPVFCYWQVIIYAVLHCLYCCAAPLFILYTVFMIVNSGNKVSCGCFGEHHYVASHGYFQECGWWYAWLWLPLIWRPDGNQLCAFDT